jgi:hypothetical protein
MALELCQGCELSQGNGSAFRVMSTGGSRPYSNLRYGWSSLTSHDYTVLPASPPFPRPLKPNYYSRSPSKEILPNLATVRALMRFERNGRVWNK